MYKIKMKLFILDRYFRIKQEDTYSELKEVKVRAPQKSVLGPVFFCTPLIKLLSCYPAKR